MNRVIHYTHNGSLNRRMLGSMGLGDNNDTTFLQESGSVPVASTPTAPASPGIDWASIFSSGVNAASNSYKTYTADQVQQQQNQLAAQKAQNALNLGLNPNLLPVQNNNTIANVVLIGGIVVAGIFLLKFAKANRK